VAAVKKASLVDTLNSAANITVFAPANSAFAKIPSSTLNSVLANKTELTKILTHHVAPGRYTPAELASGKPIKTLEGATVKASMSGGTYSVNGAQVVCGNVQTANATVYIINTVLMPPVVLTVQLSNQCWPGSPAQRGIRASITVMSSS